MLADSCGFGQVPCPSNNYSAAGSSDESQCIVPAFALCVYNIGEPSRQIPDFSTLPLIGTANVNSVNIPAFKDNAPYNIQDDQGNVFWTSLVPGTPNNYFAASFTGLFKITTAGEYRFCLLSDDGSSLTVDGAAIVENLNFNFYHRQCGVRGLVAGVHSFFVAYFQNTDDAGILLTYSGTDTSNVEIVLQRPSAVSAPFNAWHFFLGGGGTRGRGGIWGCGRRSASACTRANISATKSKIVHAR